MLASSSALYQQYARPCTLRHHLKSLAVPVHLPSVVQGHVHRSWVQAQTLLSPVFDNLAPEQKHLTLLQQVLDYCSNSQCLPYTPCPSCLE